MNNWGKDFFVAENTLEKASWDDRDYFQWLLRSAKDPMMIAFYQNIIRQFNLPKRNHAPL
jgi:hypothetical protein